jgi:hypothetical protein
MEQIHAMLQQRQEDAIKHERLVEYFLTHQVRFQRFLKSIRLMLNINYTMMLFTAILNWQVVYLE